MIDQIKIGGFLRALRKEKELTQEQLAEKFGVSSRSVSRWENGNTMPELSVLVELADYYKVADYAEVEKKLVVKRRCIVTFVGTLMFAMSIMIGCIVFPKLPEESFLRSDGLWFGIGVIGLVLLWGTVIRENRKNAM